MTNYTVRVELHDADENDYENLHSAMAEQGFVRWIEDRDGNKYRLPTAEYNLVNTSLKIFPFIGKSSGRTASSKSSADRFPLVTRPY